jgi:hypothetical protein
MPNGESVGREVRISTIVSNTKPVLDEEEFLEG